jgi:hypothetical protein
MRSLPPAIPELKNLHCVCDNTKKNAKSTSSIIRSLKNHLPKFLRRSTPDSQAARTLDQSDSRPHAEPERSSSIEQSHSSQAEAPSVDHSGEREYMKATSPGADLQQRNPTVFGWHVPQDSSEHKDSNPRPDAKPIYSQHSIGAVTPGISHSSAQIVHDPTKSAVKDMQKQSPKVGWPGPQDGSKHNQSDNIKPTSAITDMQQHSPKVFGWPGSPEHDQSDSTKPKSSAIQPVQQDSPTVFRLPGPQSGLEHNQCENAKPSSSVQPTQHSRKSLASPPLTRPSGWRRSLTPSEELREYIALTQPQFKLFEWPGPQGSREQDQSSPTKQSYEPVYSREDIKKIETRHHITALIIGYVESSRIHSTDLFDLVYGTLYERSFITDPFLDIPVKSNEILLFFAVKRGQLPIASLGKNHNQIPELFVFRGHWQISVDEEYQGTSRQWGLMPSEALILILQSSNRLKRAEEYLKRYTLSLKSIIPSPEITNISLYSTVGTGGSS